MELSHLSAIIEGEIPLFLIGLEPENSTENITNNRLENIIIKEILKNDIYNVFRGTDFSRLTYVINHGVEGENPTDAFWAIPFSIDKALEYGGYPKMLLCYDFEQCQRSYERIKNTDENAVQISKLKNTYKSFLYSKDNKEIWFSMFGDNDERNYNRIGTPYEMSYGYYIPKNQKKALKYIVAIASGKDWINQLMLEFSKYDVKIQSQI
ncbi:hypothetical protein [Gaetbulibacter saemankumensis]|uniref:hypothetical protein n=1 Tax=Gaetbulibacter saemankumensis TaxID=311208 RepID=UPI0004015EE2|nr:hypothetical protein [Gaetbulibacter saemankumensis]